MPHRNNEFYSESANFSMQRSKMDAMLDTRVLNRGVEVVESYKFILLLFV